MKWLEELIQKALGRNYTVENGKLIENRGYYVTRANIDTLALLEETKGSNS